MTYKKAIASYIGYKVLKAAYPMFLYLIKPVYGTLTTGGNINFTSYIEYLEWISQRKGTLK